jgi:hypothetical protein
MTDNDETTQTAPDPEPATADTALSSEPAETGPSVEDVAERLTASIENGDRLPGAELDVAALAAEFQTSAATVLCALVSVADDGTAASVTGRNPSSFWAAGRGRVDLFSRSGGWSALAVPRNFRRQ